MTTAEVVSGCQEALLMAPPGTPGLHCNDDCRGDIWTPAGSINGTSWGSGWGAGASRQVHCCFIFCCLIFYFFAFLLLCTGSGGHGSIRWQHHNTSRLTNATSVGVSTTQVNCFLPHFFLCACCTVLFFLHHFSILRKFLFVHVQVPELGYQTHRLIVIFLAFCLTFFALAFLQFLQWCWESQCMPTAQVFIFAYLFPRYSGKGHIDKATKMPMMCLDTCIGGVSQAHVNCCFSFFPHLFRLFFYF